MATLTWQQIRKGIGGGSPARDEGLQRVAARLATQTVALLLVMLIALEVVVYLITQQALLGSLEATLKDRAAHPDPTVCAAFRLTCGAQGPGGPGSAPGQPQGGQGGRGSPPGNFSVYPAFNRNGSPSDASVAFVDRHLQILHSDGALGTTLLDVHGLRQALDTHTKQCCSSHAFKGQDYLVYTDPLWSQGNVVGAVQASISEHQYEGTMNALLQALVVVALLGLVTSGGISAVLVRRAIQPIRKAVQRQRDFVADAAHELRTPLAIQRTVGEVGMAEPSVEELQATVAQMLGENQHLTRLVDDLSLLARTDTNAVAIDHRPVDLSSLVMDTTSELGPLAEAQGVTLDADIQANVRGLGDILRLRQLLLILLDNALKHTPTGGTVSVRLFPQGERARLQVTDSGPGIDLADLPRIFDRFYRADRARTGGGSGLGLSIGKWIAEAHGGAIQAGNAPPRGAVFTVTLPLARASTA